MMVFACGLSMFSCSGDDNPGPKVDTTPFIAKAGSTKSDIGRAIVADGSGNTYVSGSYADAITFGEQSLPSDGDGGDNFFLVKYNSSGVPQWAKHATTEDGYINTHGISRDAEGNIYVAGAFSVDATFGSITKNSSSATADIFLAKYNQDGSVQWVTQIGGAGTDNGLEIKTDAAGNTYMTGSFTSSITFGESTLTSAGGADIFLAKFNKDGGVVWAKHVGGGIGNDQGIGIALGSTDVYITGTVVKTVKLNGTSYSGYGSSAFVAKYSTSGDFGWAKRVASNSTTGSSITLDSEGNAYVIGSLYSNATFGDYVVTYSDKHYVFLAKYSASGAVSWAKTFPGDGPELVVVTGPSDKLYAAGRFSGLISFNPSHQYNSAGYTDVYLARFDKNGTVDWSTKGGGTDFEAPLSAATDDGGNLFTTGFFHGTATFNAQSGGIVSAGAHDVFVWKVHP